MTASAPDLLPNATRDLAAFAAALRFDKIPADVIARIKLSFLDGIGVCLFGATLPWTALVRDMVVAEGGKPAAALWTTGLRTSATNAVLVNSTAGHAFEMDDIHRESILHPNSLAVPVALALAEADGTITGKDICTALVAGYEVGARIGNAATTALFFNGFHPQGTSGAFVAAVTAAKLLKLDAAQMQNAMGIAGSMGAGLMAAQEGAMVKRLHAGRAAQSGLMAALLAKRGFTGISNIVEAAYGGFLSSLSREPNVARLMDGLGTTWEAGRVGFKMYPNVTSIHAALDAFRAILRDEKLGARDIADIRVGCGKMTFVHTAWEFKPAGVTAAQMNMYYGLAAMALHGDLSVESYTEQAIGDPAIREFIPRIHVGIDDEIEKMGVAFRHAARVSVTTIDGRTLKREVLHRRGSPENGVTADDVAEKFVSGVRALLPAGAVEELKQLARDLDQLPNVARINAILGAPLQN